METMISIKEAQDFCTNLAQSHYENFPVGSRWIPEAIRPDIHAVYAFARLADDFADEAKHEGERLERLSQWRTLLYSAAKGEASHPAFVALADTIARHQVPVEWLDHLIMAFESDVRNSRHPNFDSIQRYAVYSANPVGRLVLWLHGYRDPRLFELSDRICSALQFANFWQDVAVDWKKNRIYLPQNDMERFGYTEKDLSDGIVDDRFRKLMKLEVDRTWEIFHQGKNLCNLVRRDLKIELRLVWSGGTRILERLEQIQFDVFRHRPSLRTWDKGLMLWRTFIWPLRK